MRRNFRGVFDPWRQQKPKPAKPAPNATIPEQEAALPSTPQEDCIHYMGRRGGIVVRLPASKAARSESLRRITDVVFIARTTDPGREVLERNGIIFDTQGTTSPFATLSDGERRFFVTDKRFENLTDVISFAFRELQRQCPKCAKLIDDLQITAYVQ